MRGNLGYPDDFLARHQQLIEERLSDAVEALASEQPNDPIGRLAELLLQDRAGAGEAATSSEPVLVDMDNVVCDFDGALVGRFSARHPGQTMLTTSAETRKHWSIADDVEAPFAEEVKELYCAPGFAQGLAPIPGAVEALHEMLAAGHDVRLCTSPLTR